MKRNKSFIKKMEEINTQLKGCITEQKCFLKCLEEGFTVSRPLFDNARYDFILDTGTNRDERCWGSNP